MRSDITIVLHRQRGPVREFSNPSGAMKVPTIRLAYMDMCNRHRSVVSPNTAESKQSCASYTGEQAASRSLFNPTMSHHIERAWIPTFPLPLAHFVEWDPFIRQR